MSDESNRPGNLCHGCQHLDWDSQDEYSPREYFCLRNLIFPKKDTCKARQPWPKKKGAKP